MGIKIKYVEGSSPLLPLYASFIQVLLTLTAEPSRLKAAILYRAYKNGRGNGRAFNGY
jgi:hypothetical protein